MTLDPQLVIRESRPFNIYFSHLVIDYEGGGRVDEWRGLYHTCEPKCTWYSGFAIVPGLAKFCVCISSVQDPHRMVTLAFLEPQQVHRIVKIITNQLEFDHQKRGCRVPKT